MSFSKSVRDEVHFIRGMLLDLFRGTYERFHAQGELWRDEHVQRVCEELMPFYNTRQLEKALPSEGNPCGGLRDSSMFLFLDFVEKEKALPVLDASWDLARPTIRFRFFFLHWLDDSVRPRAVGFRLEPPEGPAAADSIGEQVPLKRSGRAFGSRDTPKPITKEPGSHDYWHIQMISEFRKGDELLRRLVGDLPTWLPTAQPAFPLPAKRLGDLLAALLVSIYGARQLASLGRDTAFFGELRDRLRSMNVPLR